MWYGGSLYTVTFTQDGDECVYALSSSYKDRFWQYGYLKVTYENSSGVSTSVYYPGGILIIPRFGAAGMGTTFQYMLDKASPFITIVIPVSAHELRLTAMSTASYKVTAAEMHNVTYYYSRATNATDEGSVLDWP